MLDGEMRDHVYESEEGYDDIRIEIEARVIEGIFGDLWEIVVIEHVHYDSTVLSRKRFSLEDTDSAEDYFLEYEL